MEKPITIKLQLGGGRGSIIPNGVIEALLINIRDGSATYHFKDAKITKEFARRQNQDGVRSEYVERIQTTICLYPNMTQKEIAAHIQKRFKDLGAIYK